MIDGSKVIPQTAELGSLPWKPFSEDPRFTRIYLTLRDRFLGLRATTLSVVPLKRHVDLLNRAVSQSRAHPSGWAFVAGSVGRSISSAFF